METKVCSRCGLEKPVPEYSRGTSLCKPCDASATREWRSKNPDRHRSNKAEWDARNGRKRQAYTFASRNNMPTEAVLRFMAETRYECAICGRMESDRGSRALHIDHCHATGELRGILCSGCNIGLGHFRDNPALLEKAAEYLRQRKGTAPA